MARIAVVVALLSFAIAASALPQRNQLLDGIRNLDLSGARFPLPEQVRVMNLLAMLQEMKEQAEEQRFNWEGLAGAALPYVINGVGKK